jgi:pimeloyl-ACP methyl ester carboxylesterase
MATMFVARALLLAFLLAYCHAPSAAGGMQSQSPRPNEPRPPFPYMERSVSYPNTAAHIVLTGSFTRPQTGGPFPAVLLIPGSGRQDRNETVADHRPFLVLADNLTRHGIAVLRVDRRGIGNSTGDFAKATTQDLASDAEAGVRYLMARPDVDPKRVGLIGHGEGAMIAPLVADSVPQISFLVLLAAPAVPGEQLLIAQRERAERAAHVPEAQIALDKKIATMLYDMVRDGKKERDLTRALSREEDAKGELASLWANQVSHLQTPWLRFFLSYDPAPALEKVKCPVLALEGEKDMDVAPDQNVPALKAAFTRGGNADATVEVLPGLNYFFQTAETGLPMEYPSIAETMSPLALNTITTWIASHTS